MNRILKILKSPIFIMPFVSLLILFLWLQFVKVPNYLDRINSNSNLLSNGNFKQVIDDTAVGWEVDSNGQLEFNQSITDGYVDENSVRIEVTNYQSGSVFLTSPVVSVIPNEQYFFKSHYATDTVTDIYLRSIASDGQVTLEHLKHLPDYDYPWSAMSTNFTSSSDKVQILVAVTGEGYVELDGAYVVKLNEDSIQTKENLSSDVLVNTPKESWYIARSGIGTIESNIEQDEYKISMKDYGSGEASWKSAESTIYPNTAYRLEIEYSSDAVTELYVDYEVADGSYTYQRIVNLQPTPGWVKRSVVIETPANSISMVPSVQLFSNGKIMTKKPSLYQISDSQSFDKPRVSITFDDGWLSSYENGAALIEQYGFFGTYYINPATLGRQEIMSESQTKDLAYRGHQIASHSNEHIDITSFTRDFVRKDLSSASKNLIKLGVNGPIDYASPYGKFDQAVLSDVMSIYATHRGTDTGINTKNTTNYQNLKSLFMRKEVTDERLQDMLSQTKNSNGWLILIYHQIEASETPFAIERDTFIRQLDIIKASGIEVQTVRQATEQTQK